MQEITMRYPYIFYSGKVEHCPVFRGLEGDPLIVDLSSESSFLAGILPIDQKILQNRIEEAMGYLYSWGIASYLENREKLLADCPQMIRERRFYHLGLDIVVDVGVPLHAPLHAQVKESGYEEGGGNYGGFVLLEHQDSHFETFFSLYGHLKKDRLPVPGTRLKAGEYFAETGDFYENGNWFYHTHIQVITKQGLAAGYLSKGYCTAADLSVIDRLCPSPLMLFSV